MPSLQDALAGLAGFAPVPKIRPEKAAAPKKPKKAPVLDPKAPRQARRVPIETFAVAVQKPVYGETDRHSESRPPKQHDDVFPERFFGGPLYSSARPAVPFLITKMKIGTKK